MGPPGLLFGNLVGSLSIHHTAFWLLGVGQKSLLSNIEQQVFGWMCLKYLAPGYPWPSLGASLTWKQMTCLMR